MARKKPEPKPLAGLRFDFADALENVCNQSLLLMQAVDMAVRQDVLPAPVADILRERSAALRDALIGKDG